MLSLRILSLFLAGVMFGTAFTESFAEEVASESEAKPTLAEVGSAGASTEAESTEPLGALSADEEAAAAAPSLSQAKEESPSLGSSNPEDSSVAKTTGKSLGPLQEKESPMEAGVLEVDIRKEEYYFEKANLIIKPEDVPAPGDFKGGLADVRATLWILELSGMNSQREISIPIEMRIKKFNSLDELGVFASSSEKGKSGVTMRLRGLQRSRISDIFKSPFAGFKFGVRIMGWGFAVTHLRNDKGMLLWHGSPNETWLFEDNDMRIGIIPNSKEVEVRYNKDELVEKVPYIEVRSWFLN